MIRTIGHNRGMRYLDLTASSKRFLSSLDYQSALQLLKLNGTNTNTNSISNNYSNHSPDTHQSDVQIESLNLKDLRSAYFQAAKECHPDALMKGSSTQASTRDSSEKFMLVSDAYEVLLAAIDPTTNVTLRVDGLINEREELQFRRNCRDWLGIPADVVEESKRCPLFRQWLKGNTDAAFHWKSFLIQNGGLAPRLREYIQVGAGSSINLSQKIHRTRRRRSRRH